MDKPIVYACSDSLGETAERVARAAASQFNQEEFNIVRIPYIRSEQQIDDIVKKAENNRLQDAIEVSMDNSYQYVMISLSGGILFDSGSADIKKGASMIIGRVGDILKNYSNKRIKIEGHTDNVPIGSTSKYSSNWELSTARATSVLQYLAQKKGLNAKYLEASGRADVNPVADNKTEKGRSKNRRVEIKIYSNND